MLLVTIGLFVLVPKSISSMEIIFSKLVSGGLFLKGLGTIVFDPPNFFDSIPSLISLSGMKGIFSFTNSHVPKIPNNKVKQEYRQIFRTKNKSNSPT